VNFQSELVLTHDDRPNCFHRNGGIPPLAQLPPDERSMYHAVTAELELGTVCEFTAIARNNIWRAPPLETVTANCTVNGLLSFSFLNLSCFPTADSSVVLPAVCTYNETCDCRCSQGFIQKTPKLIDGNICDSKNLCV